MSQTVVGIFDDPSDAQDAVQQLLVHGFSRADIDISMQKSEQRDKNLSSFFTSLFGTDTAKSYTEVARQSGAVVTVHADSPSQATQAANILDEAGALDMDEQAYQYGTGVSGQAGLSEQQAGAAERADVSEPIGTRGPVGATGKEETMAEAASGENAIPIIEEQLNVGKREVETGRVKLRSKIIEQPVEEHLRLREEHVHVERHAVNRPASGEELTGFKEGEIEIVEHAEVPVVNKEARVVEEVQIEKEIGEREEIVREKLRKTQVNVEGGKRPK
jgi:stress response protein YsnF